MTDALDMQAAADVAGLHYDTFRKRWPQMVAAGFPPPFRVRPYLWRPEPLALWRLTEEARIAALVLGQPLPANDAPRPRRVVAPKVARQRGRMLERMRRHG